MMPRYVTALTTERFLVARFCMVTSRFDPAISGPYGWAAFLFITSTMGH
jgi:hypothetical protein